MFNEGADVDAMLYEQESTFIAPIARNVELINRCNYVVAATLASQW